MLTMKIENGKILEATKRELFQRWLDDKWADFMPFEEYLFNMERAGVKITEVKGYGNTKTTMPT